MNSSSQKNKYQAYAAANHTVAKTQQILMIYDGLIRMVAQAKEAIRENRIEDRYHILAKASNIVHGLQGCLDFENGKEIANILYSFYASIDSRIFSIHRSNSVEMCEEVITDLKLMRDAWQTVDETALQGEAPAIAPETPAASGEVPPAAPISITLTA